MTRYWQNLFVSQKSIQMEKSITYPWKRKKRTKKLKNPKPFIEYSLTIDNIYENLENIIQQRKTGVASVWWYDSRCGSRQKTESCC